MTVTINQFNLAELFVIASFSTLIGIAFSGIAHILIGEPIFNIAQWMGICVLIGVCTMSLASIYQEYKKNIAKATRLHD